MLVRTIAAGNLLGEGVLWRESDQTLWWTDILGRRLYCHDWSANQTRRYETPDRLTAFAFTDRRDDLLLAAFDVGVALFEPAAGRVQWLDRPTELSNGVRLNDGRVDPRGRFWVGSMREGGPLQEGRGAGVLYRLEADGRLRPWIGDVGISNGLAFDEGAERMFFADSVRGEIYSASYSMATGAPGVMRVLATFEGISPDGATVDAAGGYWSALWDGGRVVRLDADGQESFSIEVPCRHPTCVAFGGPDMSLLFVSSACVELSASERAAMPSAGDVFVYQTPWRGVPGVRAKI